MSWRWRELPSSSPIVGNHIRVCVTLQSSPRPPAAADGPIQVSDCHRPAPGGAGAGGLARGEDER